MHRVCCHYIVLPVCRIPFKDIFLHSRLHIGDIENGSIMKKTITLVLFVMALFSCGGVSDARIDAYSTAANSVKGAATSEELVEIAYLLSNRLDSLERHLVPVDELQRLAADGDNDSRKLLDSIDAARERFVNALSEKEMSFYINKTKKKRK